ncbi:MAG: DUF4249 domain-containing protein [Cyclobacteriaceae bacterium]
MRKSSYHHIVLLLLIMIIGCVQSYDFDPQQFEKVLVVEGTLSNSPEPHIVKISYTYTLESGYPQLVSDASVWLEDQDKTRTDYSEVSRGVYMLPENFAGQVGSSYQLFIQLEDGRSFSSTRELLRASPAIDSIYARYVRTIDEDNNEVVQGIQFYVDAAGQETESAYLRYKWEDAHKIMVPFPANYELEYGEEDTIIVPIKQPVGVCYTEESSNELLYTSTLGTIENRVAEFPVRFVDERARILKHKYALLVRQYAISEEAYLFYKRLQENNDSGGSLFDQQTGSVFGNISSNDENGEQVLGYFQVSGVTDLRRFFSRRDFDRELAYPDFLQACYLDSGIVTTPDSAFYYLQQTDGLIHDYDFETSTITIHSRRCTDCSYYADVTPPDYWED